MQPDWKRAELAVFVTQLYTKHLASQLDHSVEFDVELPDPDGEPRQFDVLYSDSDGKPMRAFEVQDRTRPLGKPDLGQFLDKLGETGVEYLTTVTTAGYRNSTMRRVARTAGATALHLSEPSARYGDLSEFQITVDVGLPGVFAVLDIDFHTAALIDTAMNQVVMDVVYGTASDDDWDFFGAIAHAGDAWMAGALVGLRGPHDVPESPATSMQLSWSDGTVSHYPTAAHLERGPLRRPKEASS